MSYLKLRFTIREGAPDVLTMEVLEMDEKFRAGRTDELEFMCNNTWLICSSTMPELCENVRILYLRGYNTMYDRTISCVETRSAWTLLQKIIAAVAEFPKWFGAPAVDPTVTANGNEYIVEV